MPERITAWVDGVKYELVRDRETEKQVAEMTANIEFVRQAVSVEVEEEDAVAAMRKVHTTEPQVISCPRCQSPDTMKYGQRYGRQEYICRGCRAKFHQGGNPKNKHAPASQISAAIQRYYGGTSLSRVAGQMAQESNNAVNPSTVYRWVMEYSQKAASILGSLAPKVSDTWMVDETVIDVRGSRTKTDAPHTAWLWLVIDEGTRFLLSHHISQTRTIRDVTTLMQSAREKADKAPKAIISDSLRAYIDGIERVFGADTRHLQTKGFGSEVSTQLIERFNGTVKDRTRVLRGFKTRESAGVLIQGYLVHYNFFRPHMTLHGKTPSEVAGIQTRFKSWEDFVKEERYIGITRQRSN